MEKFTKFEHQYILMLAGRAKHDLEKDLEGQKGYIDPNIPTYIKTLESIARKCFNNMKNDTGEEI